MPPEPKPVPPDPAVRRLSLYLRELESLQRRGKSTISSRELGEVLNFTDAQIRKDFAYFGQFGHPGVGYRVEDLIGRLKHILGTDKTWDVVLVGAGNLGRALSSYRGFEQKGFRLKAIFDLDAKKVGQSISDLPIHAMKDLPAYAKQHGVKLAILAVPAEAAQDVADQLVDAGLTGILNFAPLKLNVPPKIAVTSVDLAVQLEQLVFQVNVGQQIAKAPATE
ncbi:MAG: redox-sensing transcriptional repressor Rex [Tepidisphaeraceae bacterium]